MRAKKILGSSEPVETSVVIESSDRDATVVTVEGIYSTLKNKSPSLYCPAGMTVESSHLSTSGDGMGKLTVRCVRYEVGFSFSAARSTFRVDMQEVTYDLEDHPAVASDRSIILKWLATDESKRSSGGSYFYSDENGELVAITSESHSLALKFISAYMSGIKTFNRYFPVIEKISTYKNPPGMSRIGKSFTGGSPDFSDHIGTYNNPPISLNGYPSNHWFKSKDGWMQNADTTWTRTEQWTYTPESSSGNNAWIYNELT